MADDNMKPNCVCYSVYAVVNPLRYLELLLSRFGPYFTLGWQSKGDNLSLLSASIYVICAFGQNSWVFCILHMCYQ